MIHLKKVYVIAVVMALTTAVGGSLFGGAQAGIAHARQYASEEGNCNRGGNVALRTTMRAATSSASAVMGGGRVIGVQPFPGEIWEDRVEFGVRFVRNKVIGPVIIDMSCESGCEDNYGDDVALCDDIFGKGSAGHKQCVGFADEIRAGCINGCGLMGESWWGWFAF